MYVGLSRRASGTGVVAYIAFSVSSFLRWWIVVDGDLLYHIILRCYRDLVSPYSTLISSPLKASLLDHLQALNALILMDTHASWDKRPLVQSSKSNKMTLRDFVL